MSFRPLRYNKAIQAAVAAALGVAATANLDGTLTREELIALGAGAALAFLQTAIASNAPAKAESEQSDPVPPSDLDTVRVRISDDDPIGPGA